MSDAPARQPEDSLPGKPAAINHRYLRIEEMARFKNLVFSPRLRVNGAYAGRHTSPQRGQSVEFADYREYTPGDDLAGVDWKVYGRSDKLFIKLFEHNTDMTVTALVDASASMNYAGIDGAMKDAESKPSWLSRVASVTDRIKPNRRPGIANPSKYDQACLMAAAISFLTIKQQDKAALGIARKGLADYLRPGGSYAHLNKMLTLMEGRTPNAQAGLASAIHDLAARTRHRGLVAIFSDLEEPMHELLKAMTRLTHRGSEVLVFHVLHADELKLPAISDAVLVDSETGQPLRLNLDDVRSSYEKKIKERVSSWSAALRTKGIDYHLVSTATPYTQALEKYLHARVGGR